MLKCPSQIGTLTSLLGGLASAWRLTCHWVSGGQFVDPACGAGNLLLAGAMRVAGSGSQRSVRFVGWDISPRAVRSCRAVLSSVVARDRVSVRRCDFLERRRNRVDGEVAVIMNPPFKGYGRLCPEARKRVGELYGLKGRFNLSYAFVRHAIALFRPSQLVSLLPSNWMYSRSSSFRGELERTSGAWEWEDVGCAFDGLSVDVGILHWRPAPSRTRGREKAPRRTTLPTQDVVVRQGVATGRDEVFTALAADPPVVGRVMEAARGRDVGRKSGMRIWVPSELLEGDEARVRSHLTADMRRELRRRSCVRSGRRKIHEYHDPVPPWFMDNPKVLLPEIVSGSLRCEVDSLGRRLPLHSVIAVKVPSAEAGRELSEYLALPRQQRRLLTGAPRLSGGAVRLQVGAVRDAVGRWLRACRSNER